MFASKKEKSRRFFFFFFSFSLVRSMLYVMCLMNFLPPKLPPTQTTTTFHPWFHFTLAVNQREKALLKVIFHILFVDVVGCRIIIIGRFAGGEREERHRLWNVLCFEREFSAAPKSSMKYPSWMEQQQRKRQARKKMFFSLHENVLFKES